MSGLPIRAAISQTMRIATRIIRRIARIVTGSPRARTRGRLARPSRLAHGAQRLVADLAPELGPQRDELGRLHESWITLRQLEHALDPAMPRPHLPHAGRQSDRLRPAA